MSSDAAINARVDLSSDRLRQKTGEFAWVARRANRQIATAAHFSEEHDQPRQTRSPKLHWRSVKYTEMIRGVSRSTNTRSYNGYALSSNAFAK